MNGKLARGKDPISVKTTGGQTESTVILSTSTTVSNNATNFNMIWYASLNDTAGGATLTMKIMKNGLTFEQRYISGSWQTTTKRLTTSYYVSSGDNVTFYGVSDADPGTRSISGIAELTGYSYTSLT